MKLFYTPNSPYARICRVFVLERGLRDRVSFELTTVRDPGSPLLALNPSGKVPTLQTDDGHVLAETRIVCEYLDQLAGGARLIDSAALDALQLEGLAGNMLDGITVWFREQRRAAGEQSPGVIDLERTRARRCLNRLEDDAPRLFADPRVTYGRIAVACAIGFADALFPAAAWRTGRPRLAAWFDAFAQRPSMQATAPQA